MHESPLIAELVRRIEDLARTNDLAQISAVKVRLGAQTHISPAHLRRHFADAAAGTVAEDARLDIELVSDLSDPHAQDLVLDCVEVEE
jgi:hydrogenase nickel incorporation protein HypA/HybF